MRNRIVFGPHGTRLGGHDFLPTDKEGSYLAERAMGSVGLIVMGTQRVLFNSIDEPLNDLATHPRAAERYRRIAGMVKPHGAVLVAQLSHLGRMTTSRYTRQPIWAPSPIPDFANREMAKEMDDDDIRALVEAFVIGACNLKEGGFDGAEVYAANGYLLSEFLSPHANKRQDRYGGSAENRARLVNEITAAIREACGADFLIGLRMNGEDYTPGGLTAEDTPELAALLTANGAVDYLHISCGTSFSRSLYIPDMSHPSEPTLPNVSGRIRERVSVPVAVVNLIAEPDQAESILGSGKADLICMVRALIADPEWAKKSMDGHADQIRLCIRANVCHARVNSHVPIACIYNPTVGYEREWGAASLVRSPEAHRVLIVGGGPAGLEAARVAAELGHRVELWDAQYQLGGQVRVAAKPRSRHDLIVVVDWLEREVRRLGVKVRLGNPAEPEDVEAFGADSVIIATGATDEKTGYTAARPHQDGLPGVEQSNVYTLTEALEKKFPPGTRVIMIDENSDFPALSTAELLADQGCQVEIVTRFPHVGMEIYNASFGPQMRRLVERNVVMTPFTLPGRIEGRRVVLASTYRPDTEIVREEVDAVVLAMGRKAEDSLWRQLRARGVPVQAIGDCVAPRNIMDAVHEGHLAARKIGGANWQPWLRVDSALTPSEALESPQALASTPLAQI